MVEAVAIAVVALIATNLVAAHISYPSYSPSSDYYSYLNFNDECALAESIDPIARTAHVFYVHLSNIKSQGGIASCGGGGTLDDKGTFWSGLAGGSDCVVLWFCGSQGGLGKAGGG